MASRLGILLSGRGSNFLAIHDAIARRELPAAIALVASDQPLAPGLARAVELGLTAVAVPPTGGPNRDAARAAQERKLLAALARAGVDWVCLAGYMRVLSPAFLAAYPDRIVNIHPSLLPAFRGRDAQRQAIEHGVKVTGCTVHLVDEGVDSGPIVLQRPVPVLDGDDAETLAARILEEEHQAYPEALRRLLVEPWHREGRRLVFGRGAGPQGLE